MLAGRLDWRAAVRGRRNDGARGRRPSGKALDLLPEIQPLARGLKADDDVPGCSLPTRSPFHVRKLNLTLDLSPFLPRPDPIHKGN